VPAEDSREEAKKAVARMIARREKIKGVPLEALMASVHEGRRW